MADETQDQAALTGREQAAREAFEALTAEQQAELLGADALEDLSADEIRSRLSHLDSGDVIGQEDLAEGLKSELGAQRRVIDQLSDQREEAGLNVAKVLDSSTVDIGFLMATQVTEPTRNIIGPNAEKQRRASIQSEINLPNSTAFKMCLKSIVIRIGRVAITASGIFLGIAFFASVQMTAVIQEATRTQEDRRSGATTAEATTTALEMEKEEQLKQEKARTTWLIIMALLVSVVGISNSMLMAVTERFQEIGTMKCLGALDQFIVKLFLIESGLLGALAGITGSLVGIVAMYIVNLLRYDFRFVDTLGGMGMIVVWSILLGTGLSILAAIMPARNAARMPAAAALRTTV